MDIKEHLAQAWTTLQNNHESYERSALMIKLVAASLWAQAWVSGLIPEVSGALLLDYARSAIRPTVAFPYVALLLLTLIYL